MPLHSWRTQHHLADVSPQVVGCTRTGLRGPVFPGHEGVRAPAGGYRGREGGGGGLSLQPTHCSSPAASAVAARQICAEAFARHSKGGAKAPRPYAACKLCGGGHAASLVMLGRCGWRRARHLRFCQAARLVREREFHHSWSLHVRLSRDMVVNHIVVAPCQAPAKRGCAA